MTLRVSEIWSGVLDMRTTYSKKPGSPLYTPSAGVACARADVRHHPERESGLPAGTGEATGRTV